MNRKLAAIVAATVVTVGGLGAFVGQSVAAPQSAYPKPVRDYVTHPKGFNDSADVKASGGKISCPGIKTAKASYGGKSASVRSELAPLVSELMRISEEKYNYDIKVIYGYNCRMVRGSSSTPSNHAYARAVDINPEQNPYQSKFKSDMPPEMVATWMKYGFYWGGHYKNTKDAMHFEYIGDKAKIDEYTAAAKKDGRKSEPTKSPTKKPTATKSPTKKPTVTKSPTKPASPKPTATKTKTPATPKPTQVPCLVPLDGNKKEMKPGPSCPPPPTCLTARPQKPGQVDPQIARLCNTPKPTKSATATPKPTKPATPTGKPTKTPKATPTTDPVPPTTDPVPPTTDPVPPTDPAPPVDEPPVDPAPVGDGSDPAPVGDGSDVAPVDDGSDVAPADVKDSKDTGVKESVGGLASTGV
ncbi:M15 family metallopeptidase [Enemella evansiae]|uniref:M15 family metallopeptidase n=1 Tax=Enemella evansiae TaxID=2016499 RepID=UPI00105E02FB|nr:M15 family metallopeptidase [Enemella evansiae]TDO91867.1 D-alanyl-D-alanine carboxypeptidase-like protein [Enemella evansiae]